jgi:redox-regulated HSP33 family molecular chaperone
MVVDVTIEANGKTATYTIPESLAITYTGNLVLSTDKDGISREVEALKASAEQVLASVDHQKEILEKATGLLAQLSPTYREKKETEERFSKLESSVSDIKDMITSLVKEFKS